MKKLRELVNMAKDSGVKTLALTSAEERSALEAVYLAVKEGIIRALLIGDKERIWSIIKDRGFDVRGMEIIDEKDPVVAAQRAVKIVRDCQADLLMKGLVKTADLFKAVLDKDIGLRTGRLLSHVFLVEIPRKRRWYALSDAAIVISPTLPEKVQIIENAVTLMHLLGVNEPKVAVLSAIETVNPAIPSTLDAAALTLMASRGQIKGAIVDGPLALDVAISKRCAQVKGVKSPVAGDADLLIVPNVEAGNLMGKALLHAGGGAVAGVVMGARKPIVLTSRAEGPEGKYLSIALGVFLAGRMS